MPLKIRCPHCHKPLLAEDDAAGRRKRCPSCRQSFTVPLPVSERVAARDVASRCPRCGAPTAPGTTVCPRCHADTTTGRRLPLRRRIPLISVKTWTVAGLSIVGAALVIYVGVNIYLARFQRSQPTTRAFRPVPQAPFPAAEWAARLLDADSAAERRRAHQQLVFGGAHAPQQVARAVAAALANALPGSDASISTVRKHLAALDVLARTAADDPRAVDEYGPLLEACAQTPALRAAACCARGMLGDADALDGLREIWLREQRQAVFLDRLAQVTGRGDDPAVRRLIQDADDGLALVTQALVRLKRTHEESVLDRLLPAYWESWTWLGQARGEKTAAALFALARADAMGGVGDASDFEGEKRAIRAARDALLRAADTATPSARAAAGVILTQSAPQFRPARERIVAELVTLLPESPPSTQQTIAWTVARLTGRQFGRASEQCLPVEIRPADIEAVLRWARSSGVADPGPLTTPAEAYPAPPVLSYRSVSRVRQLERDLLRQMRQGWSTANDAMDRWSEADIGCTSRLLQLIDPAQRNPNYPALAAAIVIVTECHEQKARPALTLWRQAADQPVWVRQLAYAALGALDAGGGRWPSGWPAGFSLGPRVQMDRGQPGWQHYGRIIAAGGPAMRARIKSYKPAPLTPELRNKLLEAAEYAARQRPLAGRP